MRRTTTQQPGVPAAGTKDDHHAKLTVRLRSALPDTQLGRQTGNALTLKLDQSPEGSSRGRTVVRRIAAKGRFTRALRAVHEWCKANRHLPLDEQQRHLARAIRGHCGYYGLTGNSKRLSGFRYWVMRHWRKALARRSRKGRVTWDRMKEILDRYPPAAGHGRALDLCRLTHLQQFGL